MLKGKRNSVEHMVSFKKRLPRFYRQPETIKLLMLIVVFSTAGYTALHVSRAATVSDQPEDTVQLMVQYKPGANQAALNAVMNQLQTSQVDAISRYRVKVLRVPKTRSQQVQQSLQANPLVQVVEPDGVGHLIATKPNDPEYSKQWEWPKMNTEVLWDKTKGSSDVIIAQLDSGIYSQHPDLTGKTVQGIDIVNNDDDPSDDLGHGSMVAGLLAAVTNNGVGVAGGCWECKIMPIKIAGAGGTFPDSNIVKGLQYAVEHKATVINLSLVTDAGGSVLEQAVNDAISQGITVVAGAGNQEGNTVRYPAAYPNVLSVAGTEQDDSLSADSNYTAKIKVAAPFYAHSTTNSTSWPYNGYKDDRGTSFSTPYVTSIVALLKSAFPGATPAELSDAITKTADPCCGGKIAGGRINAGKAYDYLVAHPPAVTPPPTTPPPTTPPPTTPPPTTPPPTTPPPTVPPPPPKPGDINLDQKVNITDLSLLLNAWGTNDTKADFNSSGTVDITDLSTLLRGWTG